MQHASVNDTPLTGAERQQCIKFLRNHIIEVFNDPYVVPYYHRPVKVYRDRETGLPYVLTDENRRLYFRRGTKARIVRRCYNALCREQDTLSPHNYAFHPLSIHSDSVLVDVGAAEGIFTLKFIDSIKKACLFECDEGWIEALQATFRPWKEKIVIVNKFVSDRDDGEFVSLDHFFRRGEKPTLIKIDAEGAESEVLKGADKILEEGATDLLVCTYHRHGDERKLSEQLRQKRYQTIPSQGYMLFLWEKPNFALEEPFDSRRGLVYASRSLRG